MTGRPKAVAVAAVAVATLASAQAAAARTLQLGSRGPAVRTVQRDLSKVGIKTAVTGRYNKVTRSHVVKFQREDGLSADGVVGPITYAALVKAAKTKTWKTTATTTTTTSTTSSTATTASDSSGGSSIGGSSNLADGVTPAVKLTLNKSTGLVNIPSSGIPTQVAAALKAANQIAKLPYVYGGGHKGNWTLSSGYDCSGSVSWVLHAAGLMTPAQGDSSSLAEDSSQFFSYGTAGESESGWFTVWTNDGHAYLHISNLWFDTVSQQEDGDRWSTTNVSGTSSFTARHPTGW